MHVDVGGLRLWVELGGPDDGVPMLLCHRMASQAFEWNAALLAALHDAGYRTITYDWRGFGWSDPGEGRRYPFMALVDDAIGLLEALGVTRAHITGTSLGGVCARWLVMRRPDLACSLTQISTSLGDDKLAVWTPEFAAVAANPPGPSPEERADYILAELRVMCDERFDEAAMRARAEKAVERGYTRHELGRQMSASNKRTDEEREWQVSTPVDCPIFVAHGTRDLVLPIVHGVGLRDHYPGAEWLAIEGMGHEIQDHYVPPLIDRWVPFLRRADASAATSTR